MRPTRVTVDWFIPLLIISIAEIVLIILLIIVIRLMFLYRARVREMEERVKQLVAQGELKYKDAAAPENMIFMTANQAYKGVETAVEGIKWSAREQEMSSKSRMTAEDLEKFERDRQILFGDAGDAFDTGPAVPIAPVPRVTRITASDMPLSNNLYGSRKPS